MYDDFLADREFLMGTIITPPIIVPPVPSGNLCVSCWGIGQVFGDNPTPSSLWVTYSGIDKGPLWNPSHGEPPDGSFLLQQHGFLNCLFLLAVGGNRYEVVWNDVITFVRYGLVGMGNSYGAAGTSKCSLFCYTQEFGTFVNGSAFIELPEVE